MPCCGVAGGACPACACLHQHHRQHGIAHWPHTDPAIRSLHPLPNHRGREERRQRRDGEPALSQAALQSQHRSPACCMPRALLAATPGATAPRRPTAPRTASTCMLAECAGLPQGPRRRHCGHPFQDRLRQQVRPRGAVDVAPVALRQLRALPLLLVRPRSEVVSAPAHPAMLPLTHPHPIPTACLQRARPCPRCGCPDQRRWRHHPHQLSAGSGQRGGPAAGLICRHAAASPSIPHCFSHLFGSTDQRNYSVLSAALLIPMQLQMTPAACKGYPF